MLYNIYFIKAIDKNTRDNFVQVCIILRKK